MNNEKEIENEISFLRKQQTFVQEDWTFKNAKTAWCLKKNVGMHLFRLRQERNITAQCLCKEINIDLEDLDRVETGILNINWDVINRLLYFYSKRIKIDLVDKESKEEKAKRLEKEKDAQLLEQAKEIIAEYESSQAALNNFKDKVKQTSEVSA